MKKIITENLYWVGVLDPDLKIFDIIMHTDYGTTYNSYLLKTSDGVILFETVKEKFFSKFLENINNVCSVEDIKYIVIDHTEPDHVGSLEKILKLNPSIKIVSSSVANTFLKDILNMEFNSYIVNDNDELEFGGYKLRFLSVPFLHWPDSMYTYIEELKTLVTCDSFGCHYCNENIFNDKIDGDFRDAYKYYFDMIMGPFKKHIRYALEKISAYDVDIICPGHGPVLRENLEYYIDLYDQWSSECKKSDTDRLNVVIAYVSAYGYTQKLAEEIKKAILESENISLKVYDLVYDDYEDVFDAIKKSDGFLLGTPTINGDALPPISKIVNNLNGIIDGGKVVGIFGSYGWSGEGPDILLSHLKYCRMNVVEPAYKIKFKPDKNKLEGAYMYGKSFLSKLNKEFCKIESSDGKTYWKCIVCGEIFESILPPEICPVCGAGKDAFVEYKPKDIDFRSDTHIKIAIIGSGIAAVSAADAIRKRNKIAEIDLYTSDSRLPYNRPFLTKAILSEIKESDILIHDESWYKSNNINLHLGKKIIGIDKINNRIFDKEKKYYEYEKLIIATGANSFIPPIKGVKKNGVFSIRDIQDLEKIKYMLRHNSMKSAVVIGGGLLGLETADFLNKLNIKTSVVESISTILPRQTDFMASCLLKNRIENSGVDLFLDRSVYEIYGDAKVEGVITNKSENIPADIVIISAGIRSDISLAEDINIKINRAICVNNKMETNVKNIYACGDCSIAEGRFYGLWNPAMEQGNIAGANAVGDNKVYVKKNNGATLNSFGTRLFSIGDMSLVNSSPNEFQAVMNRSDDSGDYSAFYFKNDMLFAGVLIGDLSKTNLLVLGVNGSISMAEAKINKLC